MTISDAIRAMLIGDPHVKLAFGNPPPIYAEIRKNPACPYVTFDVREKTVAEQFDLRLTVWTCGESRADITRRLDALAMALRIGAIDFPGVEITSRRIRLIDIFTDDSFKTRNGLLHMRLQIKTIETIQ